MDSTEWKSSRPHSVSGNGLHGVGVAPVVDNLAFAIRASADVLADAIRYHGDQMVEAAKNRKTRE